MSITEDGIIQNLTREELERTYETLVERTYRLLAILRDVKDYLEPAYLDEALLLERIEKEIGP